MRDPAIYRLCVVTDRDLARGRRLEAVVTAAVRGGATMVQLREKRATTRELLEEARSLKAALVGLHVPLIINDRVDIALAAHADGVHVGQTDMPVEVVRELVGPLKIIGLSITNEEQVLRRDADTADYLGIGPIHAQTTKADASAPLGIGGFAALRHRTAKPVIAIGGVKAEHTRSLFEAGADGVAVVSAIMSADDCTQAARELVAPWLSSASGPRKRGSTP
jgi:thiamine-phosphate pyrophosphorylase